MRTVFIIDAPRYPNDQILAFERRIDAEIVAAQLHGDDYEDHVHALPLISDQGPIIGHGCSPQPDSFERFMVRGIHDDEVDHGDE